MGEPQFGHSVAPAEMEGCETAMSDPQYGQKRESPFTSR